MKNIKRISLLLSWKICNSRLCWILLLLVLSVGLKAQTKTVSGTIVDASNPLLELILLSRGQRMGSLLILMGILH